MTTSDAMPREAITEQLDSVLALHKFGEDIVPMSVTERQADAVIAELWRMADDPAVVEAVDEALMEWARHPDRLIYGFDHDMRSVVAITATLTALIGPRPVESFSASDVGQAVELYRALAGQESENDDATD